MSGLRIEQLRVERGGAVVVDDVSLVVERGSVLSLLGPSGAGKSSLLLAIAGLIEPAAGAIVVDGVDVAGVLTHQRNVGMVFQEYALFPHLDVGRNIAYGLRDDVLTKAARRDLVRSWLDRVGLPAAEFADRDVATLSGGQRQRVALARALAPAPPVLLLDEPLGALDRQLREELVTELAGLVRAEDGPAVIAVTHDRDEAFTLGDEVAVLHDGRLVQVGTPDDLWAGPTDVWTARFLGHPNVLDADVARSLGLRTTGPVIVPVEAVTYVPATSGATSDRDHAGTILAARWAGGRRIVDLSLGGITLTAAGGESFGPQLTIHVRIDQSAVRELPMERSGLDDGRS